MQKIEKAWSNFLKVLNEAGKLKQYLPVWDETNKLSEARIELVKAFHIQTKTVLLS